MKKYPSDKQSYVQNYLSLWELQFKGWLIKFLLKWDPYKKSHLSFVSYYGHLENIWLSD